MRHLLAALLLIPLVGGAPTVTQVAVPPTPVPQAFPKRAAADSAVHDSDEAYLKRNPLPDPVSAATSGMTSRLGDMVVGRLPRRRRAAAETTASSAAIDGARLTSVDRIAYECSRIERDCAPWLSPDIVAADLRPPIDHVNTLPVFYADIASGQSVAPSPPSPTTRTTEAASRVRPIPRRRHRPFSRGPQPPLSSSPSWACSAIPSSSSTPSSPRAWRLHVLRAVRTFQRHVACRQARLRTAMPRSSATPSCQPSGEP